MAIFENYPAASWQVGDLPPIFFPATKITESGGNRLVPRERPYRDGAKQDDTGSKPKAWNVSSLFENSLQEEGLDQSIPLYPDVANRLIASFDIHETGNLTLPTRGVIRCRASDYTRDESNDLRDGCSIVFTWSEDNEEMIGNQQFELPQVNASARRLGEQTVFSASDEGVYSASLADLREFASELEAYANAPGNVVADVDKQAGIVIGASNRVLRAFSRDSDPSRRQLTEPESSLAVRRLYELADMAGRSRGEAFQGRPKSVPYTVSANTDLYTVAMRLDQSAEALIAINPSVDPLFVPAGTTIKVLN